MGELDPHEELVSSGWHPDALKLAIPTGFRCEYCRKDFFASLDDYYSFQVEHIVPKGNGGEEPENLTAACRTCNFLKRTWDPRTVAGENSSRSELITAVREYVSERRRDREAKVAREREMARAICTERERRRR